MIANDFNNEFENIFLLVFIVDVDIGIVLGVSIDDPFGILNVDDVEVVFVEDVFGVVDDVVDMFVEEELLANVVDVFVDESSGIFTFSSIS